MTFFIFIKNGPQIRETCVKLKSQFGKIQEEETCNSQQRYDLGERQKPVKSLSQL